MQVKDLFSKPGIEVALREAEDAPLVAGYTSDLLSDVMAHAPADSVLITIQAHRNTVAVATLANVRAILLCHNRPVAEDMLSAARQEHIAILRTAADQFTASVLVHQWLAV